jgi:hypothetical protein
MKKTIALLLLIGCTGAMALAQSARQTGSEMLQVDYQKLVSRADLNYTAPVDRSEAGIPIGNGTMGSLLWTIPSQLKMQINRVDIFASNSSSNNFFQRNTDYCGGAAFVDVDFGTPVFKTPDFNHSLSCYEGLSILRGKAVEVKTLAWNKQDVMALDISDRRKNGVPVRINLRTLRMPVTTRGNHTAISKVSVQDGYIVLTQEFREDKYYCGSAVVVGTTGGKAFAEWTGESEVRLTTEAGATQFTAYIASAASFDPSVDLTATAIQKLKPAMQMGFTGLYADNRNWWSEFWQRSFISLKSKDGEAEFIEKNYTYYLYVMGACSRGDYPTKFNGMLWTTGGDARKWGGAFWGANQSCLYNALFPTNHPELMDPMFNMHSKAFASFEKSAVQQWGSKGIYIPETVGFDGVPQLPDSIAAEMRELYLSKKPWAERSTQFMAYAETKQPFLSRWNWKKDAIWKDGRWPLTDRGGGPYGPVSHIFSRSAKHAYQYWQRYEYSQDMNWLRERAYPMLKGMAEFYRNFPGVKKETDGKYHIYHVNDNESIWGGHNTVEEISAMMGIFPAAIKASEILGVDENMRLVWKEFIDHLSPLSGSSNYPKMGISKEKEIWVGSLPPWIQGNGQRKPDGNTMPVWFFDLCNLESDPQMREIAQNTFEAYFPGGINKNIHPYVLSKLPVAGAILGNKDAIRFLLPNQIRRAPKDEVLANRMDLSEGFYTTNIQRLGRAADALQLALNQTAPSAPGKDAVIHVFPAWPEEWDAQYTLLTRGNFLVSASRVGGVTEFVEILSRSGVSCQIKNPWPGKRVAVYRNGKQETVKNDERIILSTNKNDRLVLVPEGRTPQEYKRKI